MVCSKKQLGFWGGGSSATLGKFCNFYPHLSLQTAFPTLNLPQNCYIMATGSLFQHIYPARKTIVTICQNMKAREKSQFPNCSVNWEKRGSISKSQFSISSMNWEKIIIPARTTFKNPNFQPLCELGKTWKYSLSPRIKSPYFESID